MTKTVLVGKSHVLHDFYSLPYMGNLGFISCILYSKHLGIGPCERSWGDVKKIKTGKRSYLGVESTKKRSVLYTTAKIHDARINRNIMENIDAEDTNEIFGDDDIKS